MMNLRQIILGLVIAATTTQSSFAAPLAMFRCKELNENSLYRLNNNKFFSVKIENFAPDIDLTKLNTHDETKKLELSHSNVTTEQAAAIIQHFPNLEELSIFLCSDTPAAGLVTAAKSNPAALQNLKTLNVSDTTITTDQMLALVQGCPHLTTLDIDSCGKAALGLATALKANPNALQQLKNLTLSGIEGTPEEQLVIMSTILTNCPQLEKLDIYAYNNTTASAFVDALKTNALILHNLKSLELAYATNAANEITTIIEHCPNLVTFAIPHCYNAPAGLLSALNANARALDNLQELDLFCTNVSDDLMENLIPALPNLKKLDLQNCPDAPTGLVNALAYNHAALRNLQEINLSYTNITAADMQDLVQDLPNLIKLDLHNYPNASTGLVPAANMQAIVERCLKIEYISYDNATGHTLAGLAAALETNHKALQHLKELKLFCGNDAQQHHMTALLERCKNLEKLQIRGNDNPATLLANALKAKANILDKLQELELSDHDVTAEQMEILILGLSNLKKLTVCFIGSNAQQNLMNVLNANPKALDKLQELTFYGSKITIEQHTFLENRLPNTYINAW